MRVEEEWFRRYSESWRHRSLFFFFFFSKPYLARSRNRRKAWRTKERLTAGRQTRTTWNLIPARLWESPRPNPNRVQSIQAEAEALVSSMWSAVVWSDATILPQIVIIAAIGAVLSSISTFNTAPPHPKDNSLIGLASSLSSSSLPKQLGFVESNWMLGFDLW